MEHDIVGPGIVIYKNAIPIELDIINRLEQSLNIDGSPFKWSDAKVGFFEDN